MFTRLTKTMSIHWLADAPPTRYMTEKKKQHTTHTKQLNVYNCVFTHTLCAVTSNAVLISFHRDAVCCVPCCAVLCCAVCLAAQSSISNVRVLVHASVHVCVLARAECVYVSTNWKCSLSINVAFVEIYTHAHHYAHKNQPKKSTIVVVVAAVDAVFLYSFSLSFLRLINVLFLVESIIM